MIKHLIANRLFLSIVLGLVWQMPIPAQMQHQEKLLQAVPENCLALSLWNHGHPVPENSTNQTDQLLSEPAVRQFLDSSFAAVLELAKEGARELPPELRRDADNLIETGLNVFFRGAGCLIVKELEVAPQGPGKFEAVALLMLNDKAPAAVKSLGNLLESQLGPAQTMQIGQVSFRQFQGERMGDFSLLVGQAEGCLIVGTGVEFVEATVKRLDGSEVNAWVKDMLQRVPLERRTALGYVNLASIREKLIGFAPPEISAMVQTLGLDNVKSIETSSGYVETSMANRMLLRFEGEPTGMFALSPEKGLELSDLAHIPSDAMFAFATSMDLNRQFEFFLDQLHQMSPREAEQMEEGLEGFRRELQVDLQDDLLSQIGPILTLHNAAGDGWLSGLTLTAELKDEERFANALFRMGAAFTKETQRYPDAPQLITKRMGDATVTTLIVPEEVFPFEISVCVHQKKLLVGLFPQAIMTAIQEQPASLFTGQLPQASFAGDQRSSQLMSLLWFDTRRPFEWLYPLAQMGMAMRHQMANELPPRLRAQIGPLMQSINLPPARSIYKHLLPSVISVRRVEDGFEFESQQSLPMLDPVVVMPLGVALVLPAVQQVRVAARRAQSMNNLKQMAIAMHNYESAYRRFPSGFGSVKKDGPPVSWRVLILPFLEQNNLYDMYKLDEPWDSENNLKVLERMPEIYRSPNSNAGPNETSYLTVGGRNGIFGEDPQGNAIQPRFAQILDGSSNTIMLVDAGDSLAVPWTKPDRGIDPDNFSKFDLLGQFPGGFNAGMGDGSVHFISESIGEDVLKNLFEKNDGQAVSPYGLDGDR